MSQSSLPFFACPICRRRSFHPQDIANRYCAVCGFVDDQKPAQAQLKDQTEHG